MGSEGRTRREWITSSLFGVWKELVRWITSLLLTRKFQIDWFKFTFLGKELG